MRPNGAGRGLYDENGVKSPVLGPLVRLGSLTRKRLTAGIGVSASSAIDNLGHSRTQHSMTKERPTIKVLLVSGSSERLFRRAVWRQFTVV